MITYLCPACNRPLEVDDELAGKRAACPHCGGVGEVPRPVVRTDGVPVARPAATGARAVVAVEEDRAAKMGLPPDSGPEQTVMTVHPVTFRAKPVAGTVVLALIVGGLGLVIAGFAAPVVGLPGQITGGFLAAVGLIWLGVWKVMAMTVALTITNKRTVERRGLLSRQTREILHDKVQDLQINQSFLQRVLKVGSIGVSSAGEAGVEIFVQDLPDPVRLREVIDAYREIG